MVQSRGNEPVPNWILASRLQIRRSLLRRLANSLLRRFINMSILRLAQ
jgi:hypothetical protein